VSCAGPKLPPLAKRTTKRGRWIWDFVSPHRVRALERHIQSDDRKSTSALLRRTIGVASVVTETITWEFVDLGHRHLKLHPNTVLLLCQYLFLLPGLEYVPVFSILLDLYPWEETETS
jgi:hypothetical protein